MKMPPRLWMAALASLAAVSYSAQAVPIEVPNSSFEVPRTDFPDGLSDGADVYMVPSYQSWYQFDVNTNGGTLRYWNPGDPANPLALGQARWADTGFGGNAPDGDHVVYTVTRYNDNKLPDGTSGAYVRDYEAVCQVLEEVLFDPAETYTLTVKVGNPPGTPGDPGHGTKEYAWNGYMVQLLAGGAEYNEGSSYAPTVFKENGGTIIAQDSNSVTIAANSFATISVTYTPGDLTTEEETALAGLPIQIRLCALEGPDHSVLSVVAFDDVTLDGPEQPASGTDYATWAGDFTGFTDTSENVDFDNGGLESGVEYVVGGDPTDASDDAGKAPTFNDDGTNMIFTFVRDQLSIHPDTTVTIEVSTDLSDWTETYTVGADTAESTAGVTVTKDTSTGFDTVTLTVAKDPDAKKFARLDVAVVAVVVP